MTKRPAKAEDASAIREIVISLSGHFKDPKCAELPKWFMDDLSDTNFCRRINSD